MKVCLMDNEHLYRKLQQHLDQYPIGFPATASGVEIDLLKYFFNAEEVKVALCLSLTNSTPARIARRYKRDFCEIIEHDMLMAVLEGLFMKGCIRRSDKKPRRYGSLMLAIGMFEFHVDDLTPELMQLLHRYYDEAFMNEIFRTSLPQLRTSPHFKSIVPEHRIDTYDNMRRYIKKTKKIIHVARCVCKQGEEILGRPCSVTDDIEVCIQFGPGSYLDRGRSRIITRDEALAILDKAEEKGLIIQPGNSLQAFCICLCCGCCCGVLTSARKYEKPAELFASNYYVMMDTEKCNACGKCIKRCQMEALTRIDKETITLDINRCIGCGLCVTKCITGALQLVKKEKKRRPPINIEHLYLSILYRKAGRKKMIINLLKLAAGMRL